MTLTQLLTARMWNSISRRICIKTQKKKATEVSMVLFRPGQKSMRKVLLHYSPTKAKSGARKRKGAQMAKGAELCPLLEIVVSILV